MPRADTYNPVTATHHDINSVKFYKNVTNSTVVLVINSRKQPKVPRADNPAIKYLRNVMPRIMLIISLKFCENLSKTVEEIHITNSGRQN